MVTSADSAAPQQSLNHDSFALMAARPPHSWLRWISVALCVAGWWISLDLANISLGNPATNPLLQASCGAPAAGDTSTLDCRSVLASEWGTVALTSDPRSMRIPIAFVGAGYFAFVGVWFLLIGPSSRARVGWHILIALVVGVGVFQSGVLTYAMASVLRRWCPGCIAVHVVNGLLLLTTLAALPWRSGASRAGTRYPSHRAAIATLLAGAALFLAHRGLAIGAVVQNQGARWRAEYEKIARDPEFVRWNHARQQVWPELLNDTGPAVGQADAAHTVVFFGDLGCAACRNAHALIGKLMADHPRQIRVKFRHFPLDSNCNPAIRITAHEHACEAAAAVEAARQVGDEIVASALRERLYEKAHELSSVNYSELIRAVGLDVDKFRAASASAATAQRVRDDIALAARVGVTNTPALFLDGRRVEHWLEPKAWLALLDIETAPQTAPAASP